MAQCLDANQPLSSLGRVADDNDGNRISRVRASSLASERMQNRDVASFFSSRTAYLFGHTARSKIALLWVFFSCCMLFFLCLFISLALLDTEATHKLLEKHDG